MAASGADGWSGFREGPFPDWRGRKTESSCWRSVDGGMFVCRMEHGEATIRDQIVRTMTPTGFIHRDEGSINGEHWSLVREGEYVRLKSKKRQPAL